MSACVSAPMRFQHHSNISWPSLPGRVVRELASAAVIQLPGGQRALKDQREEAEEEEEGRRAAETRRPGGATLSPTPFSQRSSAQK